MTRREHTLNMHRGVLVTLTVQSASLSTGLVQPVKALMLTLIIEPGEPSLENVGGNLYISSSDGVCKRRHVLIQVDTDPSARFQHLSGHLLSWSGGKLSEWLQLDAELHTGGDGVASGPNEAGFEDDRWGRV